MTVTIVRLHPDVESGHEVEQARWKQTLTAMELAAEGKVVSGHVVHAWLESWGTADEQARP